VEDRATRDPNRTLTVKDNVRNKKVNVTPADVLEWAEGTLGEWLPGYTDYSERANVQYKITQLDSDNFKVELAHDSSCDPRVFKVLISVEEVP
jgi:hypothetical protein